VVLQHHPKGRWLLSEVRFLWLSGDHQWHSSAYFPTLPDQFVQHLVPAGRYAARSLLEESIAGAYRDRRPTMEQVRELLGFGTRMQVDAFLQLHEIYDYTVEDLNKDMATLNRLLTTNSR